MSVRKHSVLTTSASAGAGLGQAVGDVRHGLRRLGGDAAVDDDPVEHPALPGHDDEVTGADERAVRAERLVHPPGRYVARPIVRRRGQEKDWPQPQVRLALGFVMANPDWSRPSL